MSEENFTIAVAVNNPKVLENNLYLSPDIQKGAAKQILVKKGYSSASLAYNSAIDDADNDIIVFVHQDVYFPEGWFSNLARWISRLDEQRVNWGVLGCFGSRQGAIGGLGRVYTTGLGVHGKEINEPEPIETLDEIVLVTRRSSGLWFDPSLPHFHLYGTDICMSARDKGMANYVIPGFCIHNTHQLLRLPSEFYKCYFHIKRKWKAFLPIYTSCIRISFFNEKMCMRILHEFAEDVLGIKKLPMARVEDLRIILDSIHGYNTSSSGVIE